MHFPYIFLIVCMMFMCITTGDEFPAKSKEDIEADNESVFHDTHTIVALIDIVFTDGAKKSCTGSIIHENVVITVAHCFIHDFDYEIQPELTTSFVVIGTKKMFDSGYEQYLPIERIITHPKFKGWTADLALVFTFAGMTGSDKPGRVIKLAGEKMTSPVDSNVTVFSWGKKDYLEKSCEDDLDKKHKQTKTIKHFDCPDSSEEDCDNYKRKSTPRGRTIRAISEEFPEKQFRLKNEDDETSSNEEEKSSIKNLRVQSKQVTRDKERKAEPLLHPLQKIRLKQIDDSRLEAQYLAKYHATNALTTRKSRYLHPSERTDDDEEQPSRNNTYNFHKIVQASEESAEYKQFTHQYHQQETLDFSKNSKETKDHKDVKESKGTKTTKSKKSTKHIKERVKRVFNNWRRSMDNQNNVLTVETFGFVNMATCKKILDNTKTTNHYEIKNGEIACYSSDDYHITDNDSGAPAIRRGQLVAVTVGGAECDGDRVGVGLKISCYCSWISENLPDGGGNANCCKNCCDVKHTEDRGDHRKDKTEHLKRMQ